MPKMKQIERLVGQVFGEIEFEGEDSIEEDFEFYLATLEAPDKTLGFVLRLEKGEFYSLHIDSSYWLEGYSSTREGIIERGLKKVGASKIKKQLIGNVFEAASKKKTNGVSRGSTYMRHDKLWVHVVYFIDQVDTWSLSLLDNFLNRAKNLYDFIDNSLEY